VAIQERDDRISELGQELKTAHAHVAEREASLRSHSEHRVGHDEEVDQLKEQIRHLNQELDRLLDEENRAELKSSGRESEIRNQLEELMDRHASTDAELKQSRNTISTLKTEVERLKSQLQTLQKESADKDVKLLQAAKKREQDRADLAGINMALDAKQQELELVCPLDIVHLQKTNENR
jgi:chromosome segregation ATPase